MADIAECLFIIGLFCVIRGAFGIIENNPFMPDDMLVTGVIDMAIAFVLRIIIHRM